MVKRFDGEATRIEHSARGAIRTGAASEHRRAGGVKLRVQKEFSERLRSLLKLRWREAEEIHDVGLRALRQKNLEKNLGTKIWGHNTSY